MVALGVCVLVMAGCTAQKDPNVIGAPSYTAGDHWSLEFQGKTSAGNTTIDFSERVVEVRHVELAGRFYDAVHLEQTRMQPMPPLGVRWENTTTWARASDGALLEQVTHITTQRAGHNTTTSAAGRDFDEPCPSYFGQHRVGDAWSQACGYTRAQGGKREHVNATITYSVRGRETVGAGNWYAWRIASNETAGTRTDTTVTWYAPQVCHAARVETGASALVLLDGTCANPA